MSENKARKDWLIKVEKVIRDEFGLAIWVRLKYFKFKEKDMAGEKILHHDLVFLPDGKNWVFVLHRINKDFVPDKRYHRMAVQAQEIFTGKSE